MGTQVILEEQRGMTAHIGGTAALIPGPAGGYYTPAVSQPEAGKMQVDFTPSKANMPAVMPVTVVLPEGQPGTNGTGACILMTDQELTANATEAAKGEIYVPGDPEAAAKFMEDISLNGGTALLLTPKGDLFYIQLPAKILVGEGNVPVALLANIRGAQGEQGPQGEQGAAGNDYVLTAADKAEMVSAVLAALPTWEGGSY